KKRFFKYVRKTKHCWFWIGNRTKDGYGRFRLNGRDHASHRASWMLFKGQIKKGYDICHKCDIKPCIKPSHLFQGTRKDNMQDASKKGRLNVPHTNHQGENHSGAKLTNREVLKIYSQKGKVPHKKLAKDFKVSVSTIHMIMGRYIWKHILHRSDPRADSRRQ